MTNKETVQATVPLAVVDYYESLRGAGQPCWFIRESFPSGNPISEICASPKAAWKDAAQKIATWKLVNPGKGTGQGGKL
jgi:hypothetical protein